MGNRITRALLSVSDKQGVVELGKGLAELGVKLLSTGGTAAALRSAGLAVTEIADYTGFPEMLDGRVKTLHPKVHGGILARRDRPAHLAALARNSIDPIDLVVVNLYPFRETVARTGCTLLDAIENIDVGGPAMLRAAAKNHDSVGVVVDPADYPAVLEELRVQGALSDATRFRLATKAFAHTGAYDLAIAHYLGGRDHRDHPTGPFPQALGWQMRKLQNLRYGENPHQQAAFYREESPAPGSLATYRQLQGKELSYNNIADADAAWECVKGFDDPACVIVKHANPCGVAVAGSLLEAYRRAFATDPTSAFGGIIAFNREVDAAAAEALEGQFVEVLIAPGYSAEARARLERKASVRVLEIGLGASTDEPDFKRIGGGMLVQSPDTKRVSASDLRVVTRKSPSASQVADLLFAWRVAKYVKSNAIVYCGEGRTLGIGAGQPSRIDSARIAAMKAGNAGLALAGSVVASDAFFPFRDGLDVVVANGAVAVIQPGGSVRDDEVIAAADEHAIAMVFTGVRHFRH